MPSPQTVAEALPKDQAKSDNRDFSDRVQGEDLEFRASESLAFHIRHRIRHLDMLLPPYILSKLLANQLITISGAASGFVAGVVVCPLDVVKTRLQAQGVLSQANEDYHRRHPNLEVQFKPKYKGFVGAFRTIIHEEGIRGLYRGLVPITIGYLPTWTIYFTVYERAKNFYPQFNREHFGMTMDLFNHFCAALTAGMASSVAVNPIWVVKTRLMIQTGKNSTIYDSATPPQSTTAAKTEVNDIKNAAKPARSYYTGTVDAFRTMYREEGFRVFYLGLVPSLFGLLHVGIHFPVYEKLKRALHTDQDDQEGKLWRLIVASSFSKMIASTITYPHEILRTRMQIQADRSDIRFKSDSKLVDSVLTIYRKEGLRGFYAGYLINLARTVPASAVTLVSFEYFKTYLLELSGHKQR